MSTSVDIVGGSTAPPLVLLHGAGANRAMWKRQVEALSDEFRVIAPDLPGHGSRARETFRINTAVRAVDDIIVSVAGGRALVVGLSAGGYVGIMLAHRAPDRINGLVLSGATAQYHGLGGLTTRLSGVIMPPLGRLLRRKTEESLRQVAPADVADAMIGIGMSMRGAGQALRSLPGRDYHALLERSATPVLILNGERDATNRKEEVAAARRWDARLEVIADAGHACAVTQPEAFSDAVRVFARTVYSKA